MQTIVRLVCTKMITVINAYHVLLVTIKIFSFKQHVIFVPQRAPLRLSALCPLETVAVGVIASRGACVCVCVCVCVFVHVCVGVCVCVCCVCV